MSTDTFSPRRPSCMRRLFGTATAFVLAAAFVYVASYLVIFSVLGLPARNESGWLGPTLRFLQTGPVEERGGANVYLGDTGPYKVFKPLNTLWLRTQTLPEIPAGGEMGEPGAGPGRGSAGEGRRGRRGAGREGGMSGQRREGGRQRGQQAADDQSTAPVKRERPGRAPGAGRPDDNRSTATTVDADAGTTETE